MQDVVIEYGGVNNRWYTGTYTMPQHVGAYDQIVANLTIECPNGDCDNWDRKAYINIQAPDGNWIQIIRYITPYGVACNHQIDLTDYASLLQGEFDFKALSGAIVAVLLFIHTSCFPFVGLFFFLGAASVFSERLGT